MQSFRNLRRHFVCAAAAIAAISSQRASAADYLLDLNYAGVNGAASGGYAGVYNNVAAALGSSGMPAGASVANPNRLYIAPGTYNTAATTGVTLSNSRSNIALIGLSSNPDDIVITSFLDAAYNPGSGALGTTGSSTLQLKGNNVSAANITFANSTDTPYIINTGHKAVTPTGDYTTGNAQTSSSQGVALLLQGDQQAFKNVKLLGYQDTLYAKGGRNYFVNSHISGDNDFIFANGTVVIKDSTINLDGDHSGGAITAASTDKRSSNGFVFLNNTITANSVRGNPVIDAQNGASASGAAANTMYLGRPWGWQQPGGDAGAVFINNKMPAAIKGVGYLIWSATPTETGSAPGTLNGGNPGEDSRYAEFASTDANGNPLDITGRVPWSKQLSAQEAAVYSVAHIFSPESVFSWYGSGYPTDASYPAAGSGAAGTGPGNGYVSVTDPSDPSFSWPAFWGPRNLQNSTNNAPPGNPTAYTNPGWITTGFAGTGTWDPELQLAMMIPEPATTSLALGAMVGMYRARRRRN